MDILEDFRRRLQDAILDTDIECSEKSKIATMFIDIEDKMRLEYQGSRYYVPRHYERRNREIRREHKNGERVAYLSRKYGLGTRAIRKIITGK